MNRSTRHKLTYRRTWSAVILLMIMALQMGVRTLHQHHYVEKVKLECSDCDHHRVHAGHLLAWDGATDDCTLCQLLTTPFRQCVAKHIVFVPLGHHQTYHDIPLGIANATLGVHLRRGPPSLL